MKPSELIDKAADIIERDGWHQGTYYKPSPDRDPYDFDEDPVANQHGACCQAGALSRAAWGLAWKDRTTVGRDELERLKVHDRAEEFVKLEVQAVAADDADRVRHSPIAWNDVDGRTAAEVVAMLRGAAERARAAGE